MRPTGDKERNAYCGFLTSHLEKTAKPNIVLQTLKNSFGYFSEMKNLTVSALNNNATDRSLLVDVIAKCFNNYEKPDKVAEEALPMFDGNREFAVLQDAFNRLTKHSLDDVFLALSENLDTATSIDILVNIAAYAVKHNSTHAGTLYSKTLILSLERDNVPEKVVKIVMSLSALNQSVVDAAKEDFISLLHIGFIRTTSESIANTIVTVIRQHKWTRQFKKLLKDNADKLDLFDKLAK